MSFRGNVIRGNVVRGNVIRGIDVVPCINMLHFNIYFSICTA
jgi:hypothetical protein